MHDIAQMLRMAAGGQAGQASYAFGGDEGATIAASSTVTTAALGISTAAADRFVIAAVVLKSTSVTVTGVTIGGVTATSLGSDTGALTGVYMFGASVPSGTTAVVVVTLSSTITVYAVALCVAYGIITTPAYTSTNASTGVITGVRNGLVFCAASKPPNAYSVVEVTVGANFDTGSPDYHAISTAAKLPTAGGSIYPLANPVTECYLGVSFAPL